MVIADDQIDGGVHARLRVKDDHLPGLVSEVSLDPLPGTGRASAFRLPEFPPSARLLLDREVGDGAVKVAFQGRHGLRLACPHVTRKSPRR